MLKVAKLLSGVCLLKGKTLPFADMGIVMRNMSGFFKSENGATTIEYALIAGLIAVVCIVAVGGVGTQVSEVLYTISDAIDESVSSSNR